MSRYLDRFCTECKLAHVVTCTYKCILQDTKSVYCFQGEGTNSKANYVPIVVLCAPVLAHAMCSYIMLIQNKACTNGKTQCVPIVVLGASVGTQCYQEVIHTCAYSYSSSSTFIFITIGGKQCEVYKNNCTRELSIHAPIHFHHPYFHHHDLHWCIGVFTIVSISFSYMRLFISIRKLSMYLHIFNTMTMANSLSSWPPPFPHFDFCHT